LRGVDDAQPARAEREVSGLLCAVEDGAFEHDFLGLAGQRQAGDDATSASASLSRFVIAAMVPESTGWP
jgi:hypothetical protein